MMLSRILDHLAARKVASLGEIARVLDAPPDAVRSMLDNLQRRGLIHPVRVNAACGTICQQCAQAGSELFGYGPARQDRAGQPDGSPCPSVSLR